MTFDEAIIKWNAALEKGPLTNPLLSSPFAGLSDKKYHQQQFINRTFSAIIEELRETYEKHVATINLTQSQYEDLIILRDEEVFEDTYSERYPSWGLTTEQAMQAWLHPELVEVVD